MRTKAYIPGEDDPYPNLREVLALEYSSLPSENLEALIESTFSSALHAEDYGNIFGVIGRVASTVSRIGPRAFFGSSYIFLIRSRSSPAGLWTGQPISRNGA